MALEFKTKEELQLMPQTMEEHLEELEDDDSDTEDLSFSSLDDDNVHEVQQRMKSSFCFCWFSFHLKKFLCFISRIYFPYLVQPLFALSSLILLVYYFKKFPLLFFFFLCTFSECLWWWSNYYRVVFPWSLLCSLSSLWQYPSIYTISTSASATQLSINGHSNGKLKQALNNHQVIHYETQYSPCKLRCTQERLVMGRLEKKEKLSGGEGLFKYCLFLHCMGR